MPLERATVALRTLHPEIVGLATWQSGKPIQRNQHVYGELPYPLPEQPVPRIFDGGGRCVRAWKASRPSLPGPRRARARGMTDYLALPLTFTTGQVHAITFATGEPNGFSDEHIGSLHELAPRSRWR